MRSLGSLASALVVSALLLIANGHAAEPGVVADLVWGGLAGGAFCLLCLIEGEHSSG